MGIQDVFTGDREVKSRDYCDLVKITRGAKLNLSCYGLLVPWT